jgi:hypothetical protein
MLLAELARDRQWSSSDIKKLAGANLVRVFREVEKVCACQTGKASNFHQSVPYILDHKTYVSGIDICKLTSN